MRAVVEGHPPSCLAGDATAAPALALQHVSKVYRLYERPSDRILDLLRIPVARPPREFWAVRDVSFTVRKGETVALIGPNGSGKSTLLQLISGILRPTSGRISTEGRIAALLELGAGFNPEFTGRENVFLNGELMGLSRQQVAEVFPQIEEFAGLGEFIDRPVKEYSTGMYVRLAFASAIHVSPDILLVDEALAVGDAQFSNRCIRKFEELKQRGVTVVFVSHDLGLVKRLADRAILLMEGRVIADGNPNAVVNEYIGRVLGQQLERLESQPDQPASWRVRHGDGKSRILQVELLDENGQPREVFSWGNIIRIRLLAVARTAIDQMMAGVLLRNRLGIDVFGTNTRVEGIPLGPFEPGDRFQVEFRFPCWLTRQDYTVTVATQNWDGTSQDWIDDAARFSVAEVRELAGVAALPVEISWWKGGLASR